MIRPTSSLPSLANALTRSLEGEIKKLGAEIVDGFESLIGVKPQAAALPPGTYENPELDVNAPDPGVIRVGNDYYMVNTGMNAQGAFPMRHSTDLVHWDDIGALLPNGSTPSWSPAQTDYWAPEIHQVGSHFVAYYTARDTTGVLRVGCAVADQVTGPYKDLGQPLVANPDVGVIDPTFLHDDTTGKNYLYWKEDSNGLDPPEPTNLMAQELSADGTQLVGDPQPLFQNDLPWEGPLVEAPEIMKHGDYYYLFYSANTYSNDKYAVGVARSTSPTGPFEKQGTPLLHSGNGWDGPGHGSLVEDPSGQDWFVYHAWQHGHDGGNNPRMLLLDRIEWGDDGWPHINDGQPSDTPQPAPATNGN